MDTQPAKSHQLRPPRHRRWLVSLAVLALITAGLVGYAYQHRVSVAIELVNTTLQPYNLRLEMLQDLQLSASSLQAGRVVLRHQASNSQQILQDLQIDYSATGLLRGRLDSVAIAAAEINIPALPSATTAGNISQPSTSSGTDSNSSALASDIINSVPFNSLRIELLQVTANELTMGEIGLKGFFATLRSLDIDCRLSQCRLSADTGISLNSLQVGNAPDNIDLQRITFESGSPVEVTLEATTNTLQIANRSSTLTLPGIRAADSLSGVVISIARLNLSQTLSSGRFDAAAVTAHAEMTLSEPYTDATGVDLGSMQSRQHLTWEQENLRLTGHTMKNDQRILTNDLRHSVATGAGSGTLEVPGIEFDNNTNKLSDLWTPLPLQADIVAGSVSALTQLDWQPDASDTVVTGTVQVTLNELSGYLNEIAFLRLSTDFAAELLPAWRLRSTRSASFMLASLDVGLELTDLSSNYRIDSESGSVELTDASVAVFGGTVSSNQLNYRLQDNDSRFIVELDRIDLSQILALSAYEGVSATGLVSGELPVRLQGLSPSISGGTLAALPPGGSIRYHAGIGGAGANSNQNLTLVNQALEHYRYNLMETQIDYQPGGQPSGELDLSIRMEGVSPALNGGQRINLNLNINDNVPALLQSLQAARSVSDSVQSRLDARRTETSP